MPITWTKNKSKKFQSKHINTLLKSIFNFTHKNHKSVFTISYWKNCFVKVLKLYHQPISTNKVASKFLTNNQLVTACTQFTSCNHFHQQGLAQGTLREEFVYYFTQPESTDGRENYISRWHWQVVHTGRLFLPHSLKRKTIKN